MAAFIWLSLYKLLSLVYDGKQVYKNAISMSS